MNERQGQNLSFHQCVQNCSGARPASKLMIILGSFSRSKAAGV